MSHSSAAQYPCLPKVPPAKVAARRRHLRVLPPPVVRTWHVVAVTVAVAAAAIALAIAIRPPAPVEATVSWVALPDVPVAVASVAPVAPEVAAPAPVATAAAPVACVAVPGRAAPAARKAGSSMFDDPDAVEDHTVGRALPAGSKPTDRVSRAEFQRELAALGGAQ